MKHKLAKQKKSKRIFSNTHDILCFEWELLYDEMTDEQRKHFYPGKDVTDKMKYDPVKYNFAKKWYWPAKDSFVRSDEPGLSELIANNEVIAFPAAVSMLLKKHVQDDNSLELMNVDAIIFDSKGKTPPSVPYLNVSIECEVGDEDMLYALHQKTY